MAISQHTQSNGTDAIKGELLEKVIIGQDLSSLKPVEKMQYMMQLCQSLGLNYLTKPFEIIKFNGKEVPYARKDCTEQLRKIHNVSVYKLESQIMAGDIYIVTASARFPDGREDSSTGVVSIAGLKGEALSNAFMKAETKAKRRVTLSICGLGILDESETESLPNAQKINIDSYKSNIIKPEIAKSVLAFDRDIESDLLDVSQAQDVDDLQEIFTNAYRYWVGKKHKDNLKTLIDAKDKKKQSLEGNITDCDPETGEVLE